MAKKIEGYIKLQVAAAKANPSPPVGPALGQRGLNIMEFCKTFNAMTAHLKPGSVVPVIIEYYSDKTFKIIIKTSPAAEMLKEKAGITSGSGTPNTKKVGKVTRQQIEEIAKAKDPDLTAASLAAAARTIAGTARSMGIEVEDVE